MNKFELKVSINQINIETWKHILAELSDVKESNYIIDTNESNTFSWYYKGDFIKAIKAVQKSSHYDIDDEYVLINLNTKSIVSGELRDDTRYHVYGQVLFGTMDISEFTRVCITEQELLDFVDTLAELPSKLDKKVKNFAYNTVRKMIEEN